MLQLTRSRSSSSSSTSSASSCLSLSPTGWSPSRPTISPPNITTGSPVDTDYFSMPPSRPTSSGSITSMTTMAMATATGAHKRRASSLSPPPESISATTATAHVHHSCAYPSWPARSSLGMSASASASEAVGIPGAGSSRFEQQQPQNPFLPSFGLPSSRISDEDLEELDLSAPLNALGDGAGLGISWSAVGAGAAAAAEHQPTAAAAAAAEQRKRRLPPPPYAMRRRSSSRGIKRKTRAAPLGVIAE